MRKSIKTCFAGLACLAAATLIAQNAEERQWLFKQESGLGNWKLANVKEQMVDDTGLNLVSGKDSQVTIGGLALNANDFAVIEVTMKADKDDGGQIFFAAPGKPLNEKASFRFPVKSSSEVQVYRVKCNSNPLWTGTIGTLRLDPTNQEGSSVQIKSIKLLPLTLAWDFNATTKLNGWGVNGDLKEIKYTPDAMTFTSGKDAIMTSAKLNFPAAKFQTFEVVMKADKDNDGQVFFMTATTPWSEKASIHFKVKASPEWQTYQVKCAANPLWTGTISQVRLDPTGPAGIKAEIKSIKLLP